MKKMKFIFVSLLFFSLIASSQNAPQNKWAVDKCTKMKTQIQADLKLTDAEAAAYYQIMLDKATTDSEKTKSMLTPEEKQAYYKAAHGEMAKKMKAAFADKSESILQWNKDNQAKFNAPAKQ